MLKWAAKSWTLVRGFLVLSIPERGRLSSSFSGFENELDRHARSTHIRTGKRARTGTYDTYVLAPVLRHAPALLLALAYSPSSLRYVRSNKNNNIWVLIRVIVSLRSFV